MFMVSLWSIFNICFSKYSKFISILGVVLSIYMKFIITDVFYYSKSDWWLHISAVETTEFYCVSPEPYLGSQYETNYT